MSNAAGRRSNSNLASKESDAESSTITSKTLGNASRKHASGRSPRTGSPANMPSKKPQGGPACDAHLDDDTTTSKASASKQVPGDELPKEPQTEPIRAKPQKAALKAW